MFYVCLRNGRHWTAWFSISKWKSGVKCENSIMELKLSDTIGDVVSRVHGNVSSEEISNVWVGHTSDTERVVVTPTAFLGMLRRQFQINYYVGHNTDICFNTCNIDLGLCTGPNNKCLDINKTRNVNILTTSFSCLS